MSQKRRFFATGRAVAIALVVTLTTGVDAFGQTSGEAIRVQWPDVLYETQAAAMNRPSVAAAENFSDVAVLPFIDSLGLAYSAAAIEPTIEFELRWVAGTGGIIDGRLVKTMPESVWLTAIDLHADVEVAGEKAGDLVLSLDSLWLPSGEFHYAFTTDVEGWDEVFEGMDAEAAQAAFASGFTLTALDILSVEFEAGEAPAVAREVPVTRRPARRRGRYTPNTQIWIGWDLGGTSRGGGGTRVQAGNTGPRTEIGRSPDPGRGRQTRGGRDSATAGTSTDGTTTRGTTTDATASGTSTERTGDRATADDAQTTGNGSKRSGKRGGFIPKSDNDDEKDRDFLGPALGAAAAIGALAYFGGTIGYYGYPAEAPIGLEAGRITDRGGALIHAAVGGGILAGGDDERLVVGLSAVFAPLTAGFHPVAGIDVWLSETGDTINAVPIVTAGLLFRSPGRLAVQLGADLSQMRPRVGLAYSFR